jgi:hypothetical protein
MQKISLKDFILTGKFGSVEVGMTKEQVIEILGEPHDNQDFGTGYSGIVYNWYEFFFYTDTGILHAIQNDSLACINGFQLKNDKIKVDTWFLKKGKQFTYSEVKKILEKDNIEYSEIKVYEVYTLLLNSGVTINFISPADFFENSQEQKDIKFKEPKDFILEAFRYFPDNLSYYEKFKNMPQM